MPFEEFQDGRHLGYQNETILAILTLNVALMPPAKFGYFGRSCHLEMVTMSAILDI